MANKTDSEAVIKLVINGQQANASLKELTDTQRKLNSELRNMKPTDPGYAKMLEQVTAVNRATSELRLQQRGLDGEIKKLKASWSDLATVAGGNLLADGIQMAVGAVGDFISGSKAAYAEAEQGQAQLEAVIKSTGGVAGKTKDQLNDLAESIMNLTGVDDDVITKSESLLLTFTNVRGEIFDKTLPAIVDMTAALNSGNVSMETIQATTLQVGKALNDPIKGMTALRKVGVSFTEDQIKTVKSMVATNDVAGAQQIILAELAKEFGGVGEALASTETGAAQKFQTRIGNIQESLGGLLTQGKSMMVDFFGPFVGWLERATATRLSETLEKDRISLASNMVQLQASNTSHEARVSIIKKLKEQYPAYLGNIDAEKTTNQELLPVLDSINKALVMRIAFQKKSEDLNDAVQDEAEAFLKLDKASSQFSQTINSVMEKANSKGLNFVLPKNLTDLQQADFLIKKLKETSSQGKGMNIGLTIHDLEVSKQNLTGIKKTYDDAASVSKDYLEKQNEFAKKYSLNGNGETKTMATNNKPVVAAPVTSGSSGPSKKALAEQKAALEEFTNLEEAYKKLGTDRLEDQMSKTQKELAQEGDKYDALIQKETDFLKKKGITAEQTKATEAKITAIQAEKKTAQDNLAVRQEAEMVDKITELRGRLSTRMEAELTKEKALINKFYDDQEEAFKGNQPALDNLKIQRTKDLSSAELREKERLEIEKQAIEAEYQTLTGNKDVQKLAAINKKYDDEILALRAKFSKELQATKEFQAALDAINKNRDADVEDATKDEEKQKKDAMVSSTQAIADAVFEIGKNNRQRETDIALNALEKQRDKELSNKKLTEKQKEAINKKYDDQAKAIKLKQWKADKAAAIEQAVINGALAVVKALPNIPLAIASGIAAAAQIAVIVATKPPEFAKGVRNFEGGPALVGEEGMEAIEENGKLWLTTHPTIATLAPGANVYTAEETAKMMNGSLGEKLYQPASYSIDNATARNAEMQYRSPVSAPVFAPSSTSSTEKTSKFDAASEIVDVKKVLADFINKQSDINERPVVLDMFRLEDKKKEIDQVRLSQGR